MTSTGELNYSDGVENSCHVYQPGVSGEKH